jgi:hypothetical protein
VAGTLGPMSPSLSNLFAVAEEHTRELPMSPYAFGAIAFCSFLALLGILWGFRGTAQKLAAGHGPHGSEYQGEGQAGRAAQADQQGSHH